MWERRVCHKQQRFNANFLTDYGVREEKGIVIIAIIEELSSQVVVFGIFCWTRIN